MNQWIVTRFDRNWKRVIGRRWVRAATKEQAEEIGRELMGGSAVVAAPYHPEKDAAFSGYVREVVG